MGKHQKEVKMFLPKWYWRNPFFEIPGWEGYAVNKYGVVKSCKRMVDSKHGTLTRTVNDKILPWAISCKGYARVQLSNKPKACKKVSVQRIVVSVFHKSEAHMPSINHEDGNKLNNYYKNLKPCTSAYNQLHACRTGLLVNKKSWQDSQSKPVVMLDKDGNRLSEFGSMCEAARETGIWRSEIRRSCENQTGKRSKLKYKFSYFNEKSSLQAV